MLFMNNINLLSIVQYPYKIKKKFIINTVLIVFSKYFVIFIML